VVKVSVRSGRVVSVYPFILDSVEEKPLLLEEFLISYPQQITSDKLYVDCKFEDKPSLERFLTSKTHHKVKIVSVRGEIPKKVLDLAHTNAKTHLENYLKRSENEASTFKS